MIQVKCVGLDNYRNNIKLKCVCERERLIKMKLHSVRRTVLLLDV
jgi:hypothetical protein